MNRFNDIDFRQLLLNGVLNESDEASIINALVPEMIAFVTPLELTSILDRIQPKQDYYEILKRHCIDKLAFREFNIKMNKVLDE